ncbi:hypothetical protein LCGC14_1110900 [marine sediment metagenome]|uniref:Nucleotide-diphospho-sugar transferase domain-containing protein n=1 Tax=marine sediment metagenome TaxID=412755 RepID=A0A0F9PPU6_9ZZZZ
MKLLCISYYTSKPRNYKPAADRLVASFKKTGCNFDVRHIEDKGGWQGAVRFKPTFIRQMMEEHPEAERIVWIDADAIVHKYPKLLETVRQDMAAYFHPHPGAKEELLSGTFLVRNTAKMRAAMDAWIEAMKTAPKTLLKPEQMTLQTMLPQLGLKVFKLPRPYCQISRRAVWSGRPDHEIPFIQHTQWSREHRYSDTESRMLPPGGAKSGRRGKGKPVVLLPGRTAIAPKKTRRRRGIILARRRGAEGKVLARDKEKAPTQRPFRQGPKPK